MRILVISNLYPPYSIGGYEERCRQVIDRLIEKGHEIRILTSDYRFEGICEIEKSYIKRRLRIHGFFGHAWLPIHLLYRLEKENHAILDEEVSDFKPNVIYIWNMGGISKSLLLRLQHASIPLVYDVSDYWIERSLKGDVWLSWWNDQGKWSRILGRTLLTLLGIRFCIDRAIPTQSWKEIAWTNIYFCSEYLRSLTARKGFKVNHGEVIHCGIEVDQFSQKRSYHRFKRLLYVGRIHADKDPLTAIRALGLLRDKGEDGWSLDLYGRGENDYRDILNREIERLGVRQQVRFKQASAIKMKQVYAEYDALLFTSNWGEPFALIPLEAMASGLPVIATADGGEAEIMRHRENGLVFQAGNSQMLESCILEMLNWGPEKRKAIAKAAFDEVLEKYNMSQVVDKMEAFLIKCVKN